MWQVKMQMSPWAWLLVGLILGWLAEWLIDLWFWRRRVEQRTARLQSELDTWRYRIHNYENATEKARADLESVQAANAELTHRLQAAESDVRSGQQRLEALRAENETLRAGAGVGLMPGELEEVRTALESARAEVSSLRQQAGEAGENQLELAAARRELDVARTDLARLRRELEQVQTLQAELDQARTEVRELADVRRQLAAARERLAKAETVSTAEASGDALVELEALRAELQNATRAEMAVRADCRAARDELTTLQVRFQSSQNELEALKTSAGELEKLRAQLAQMRLSTEAAERAAVAARADVEAARKQAGQASTGVQSAEVERQLKQATADLAAARQALAQNEQSQTAAKDEIERLRRDRDQLQQRLNATQLGEAQAKATASALEDARRQLAEQLTRADATEQVVASLRTRLADLESASSSGSDVEAMRRRIDEGDQEIEALRAELTSLRSAGSARRASTSRRSADGRDRLEIIHGIGRVYERKLYEAGVDTFAKLAQSTPEDITRIIQPKDWQKIEPDRWIQEAGKLAQQASGNE